MTVETGLVIVGGADDQLRLTNKKKRAELVTQTMVDKNIIEQIRTFLVGIMIKQTQAAMERGEIKIVILSSYICSHLYFLRLAVRVYLCSPWTRGISQEDEGEEASGR